MDWQDNNSVNDPCGREWLQTVTEVSLIAVPTSDTSLESRMFNTTHTRFKNLQSYILIQQYKAFYKLQPRLQNRQYEQKKKKKPTKNRQQAYINSGLDA